MSCSWIAQSSLLQLSRFTDVTLRPTQTFSELFSILIFSKKNNISNANLRSAGSGPMEGPGGQIELDSERSVYESDIEGDWLSAEDHSEESITPGSTISDSPRTGTPLSTTPRSTLRVPSSFTAAQREQEDALKAAPQEAAEVAPLLLPAGYELDAGYEYALDAGGQPGAGDSARGARGGSAGHVAARRECARWLLARC